MKETTPENRREFWKFQSAVLAFRQAGNLAVRLKSMTDTDELFYPLMIALHVLYSRSFKHEQRNLRVPVEIVPNDCRQIHDILIHFRDKIFAHQDTHSKIVDKNKKDLCQLIVTVEKGSVSCGMQYIFPTVFQLNKVAELCFALEKKCVYHLQKVSNVCFDKTGMPDGMYKVSTTFEGNAPLLDEHQI